MTAYEVMVVFKPQLEEEELANAISRLEETIKTLTGRSPRKISGENAGWPMKLRGSTKGITCCCRQNCPRPRSRS